MDYTLYLSCIIKLYIMKTFNNSKELKDELISKLKHHQELDTFIQGTWLTDEKVEGNGFKGCFYGCTMQTEDNPIEKFSEKYNIDLWYCYLTEKIFENLPEGEYKTFPLNSIKALPIGVNFNKIKSKFHYKLLEDQLRFCKDNKKVYDAIVQCMDLFKVDFDKISESARSAARSAAWSAARSAARSAAESAESAAWSAAWSAARSAAESAESAARSAAESAAWSAARSAAWSAYYVWMKDLLFNCIQECTPQTD